MVELEEACRRIEQAGHAQPLDGWQVVAAQPPPHVTQLGRLVVRGVRVCEGCEGV